MIPAQLDEAELPHLARGEDRRRVVHLLRDISAPIREDRITENWWYEHAGPIYLRANLPAWGRRIRRYGVRHFQQFVRWLVSGFTIKCCLGWFRRRVGFHE